MKIDFIQDIVNLSFDVLLLVVIISILIKHYKEINKTLKSLLKRLSKAKKIKIGGTEVELDDNKIEFTKKIFLERLYPKFKDNLKLKQRSDIMNNFVILFDSFFSSSDGNIIENVEELMQSFIKKFIDENKDYFEDFKNEDEVSNMARDLSKIVFVSKMDLKENDDDRKSQKILDYLRIYGESTPSEIYEAVSSLFDSRKELSTFLSKMGDDKKVLLEKDNDKIKSVSTISND